MIEPIRMQGHGPAVVVRGPSGLVFLSGIGPQDSADTAPAIGIDAQTAQTADRLETVLASRGLNWESVAKLIVHVTDISELDAVRTGLAQRFGTHWRPAFTAVQVDNLPVRGARLQLDVVAAG